MTHLILATFLVALYPVVASDTRCHVHVPVAGDAQQCQADGFWYSCAECSGGVRPCLSDTSLMQCACAPVHQHCRKRPHFNITRDMYPPVDHILRNFDADNATMVAMTPLYIEKRSSASSSKMAIAASVYCHSGRGDSLRSGETCLTRYLTPLTNNVKRAAEMGYDAVLFVSEELTETVRSACAEKCTLHVMPKLQNANAMLWRFMAYNLKEYDFVAVGDLDEPWEWVDKWRNAVDTRPDLHQDWSLGRMLQSRSSNFRIAANAPVPALNYATIIGSHQIARPGNLQLDVRDAVARYMTLRNAAAATSQHPWRSAPGEKDTLFNMPIGEHVNGWGNLPGIYGFDEGFLKRVMYPHCVQRGQLITFDGDDAHMGHQGGGPTGKPGENAYVEADLAYVQSFAGNQVIQMKWRR